MTRIQLRRGTAAAWTTANPVLAVGEVGVESDTLKYKIGDGSTAWTSLGYAKSTWSTIDGKPAVIAAGATQADARTAIGAGTSSLVLGTTSSTAKPGDYTPTSSEITTALTYTPENPANKGQANGYAGLDGGGKVPVTQLPNSIMEYKGTWNATSNTPTLADGTGNAGDVYRVSVAGSQNLGSGSITFVVSDYVIYNGSSWEKADTTDAVSSVAGKTGDVSLTKSDVGLGNVANTAPADLPISTATQSALDGKLATGATAAAATKLATPRTVQVDLGSTGSASFDGTGNILPGVTGSLPQSAVTNLTTDLAGKLATGATAASATKLATARNLQVDLSAIGAVSFDGTGNANLGVTGSLPQSSVTNLTTDLAGKLASGATAAAASKLSPGATINGVTFDGTSNITVADSTKMPTISATAVKTSNYSASVNELVPADASGGAFTVTLPSAPANTSRIIVKKVDTSSNAVTVACSGTDKFNTTSGSTTRLIAVQSEAMTAQYNSTLGVWYVIATDSPIPQLDSRYVNSGGALGTPSSGTLTNCSGLPVAGITASTSTALGVGSVELGHASDTTLSRASAGVVAVEGVNLVDVSSAQTLTSKTLTSPKINQILDTNGNSLTSFSTTASAVNFITLTNAASGGRPSISSSGAAADVNLGYRTQGQGSHIFSDSSGAQTFRTYRVGSTGGQLLSIIGTDSGTYPQLSAVASSDANAGINLVTRGTGTVQANGVDLVTTTGTQTVTSKRVDPRTTVAVSASSLTPDISASDFYAYTALAADLTINAPTGTPVVGNQLRFRFKDNGTGRALTWNSIFRAIGVTIPTTTTANKITYVTAIYNNSDTKWDVIQAVTEA